VVDSSVTDDELQSMHRSGVRGIRFNLSHTQVATMDMLARLGSRVAELGWHVQLLMPPEQLLAHAQLLEDLPAQIVFDHFGRIPFVDADRHPAFRVIARLLERERAWMKLSGAYITSSTGSPYADAAPLARAYVALAPERVVWGSDWPHVVAKHGTPDDAELIDLMLEWAPDAHVRDNIFVANPARLYGF
jgi:predicted TIM-barrel fold metal-dependent hydrolase